MASLVIDTLTTQQFLKENGYSEKQAEGFVRALQKLNFDEFATKADIIELHHKLHSLEQRLTIRLGGMIMALGAILIAIKYFG